ncbi:heme-binding protein [uncultured Nevskia sp.]|uniref:GlcG/HbpS family heme-binding protein n=1 Tax=uncultured Nevskia sp. TaxID=228950 RepID=UPI0025DBD4EF|nr:heme-binding protein [uncultured Nevskia sp.]
MSTPLSVARPVIHHAAAMRVAAAAVAKAEALGINVCVAVVDSSARLVAYLRMPNAFLISDEVSIAKAKSVASAAGLPAEVVEGAFAAERPQVREGLLNIAGFTLIRGALPLRDDELVIGSVGVSGGSEAQDVLCAEAAVAALHS